MTWQTKKLSDVIIDIKDGGTPSRKKLEYFGGDIFWCVVKDIKSKIYDTREKLTQAGLEHSSAKVWPINSVIISLGATIGQIGIAKVPTATKQGISGIVVNKDLLLPEYLVYVLIEKKEYIQSIASGTTIKEVRPKKLSEMLVFPLPPLAEQKRIVKILDEIFEKVTKARENAEKNLKNSRELFESYLQSVFTGDVEYKKLGDKSLFQIIDGDRGKNYPKKSDFHDDGYCLFLNTKNVRPDGFSFETKMFITEAKDNLLGNGKLKRNDVLLTTRGTIGNTAVYNESIPFENIRINSGMLIFRPETKLIIPEYLFAVFQSGIMKVQIKKYVSGAAQPQLPIKTLVNFSIPVPKSITEQKAIVKKLDALSGETKKLEAIFRRKIASLAELKKSVLKQAFSGEL